MQSVTYQTVSDSEANFIANALPYAGVWELVVTGKPIEDPVDRRRAVMLISSLMIDSENRYRQFRSGTLNANAWQARLDSLDNVLRSPVFETWRHSPGAFTRGPDFLKLLDEQRECFVENESRNATAGR